MRVSEAIFKKCVKQEADTLLEESELRLAQEKHMARKRAKVWFDLGTLAGVVIGAIL